MSMYTDSDSVADLITGYVRAKDLEIGVKLERTIVDTKRQAFPEKDGETTKIVVVCDGGEQLVLNKSRLRTMVRAYGLNRSNWVGKTVQISRGTTQFGNDVVPCVLVEPVVATAIAARPRPVITSGRQALGNPEPPPAPPPSEYAGPSEIDDDIPF
jgi:hypothetical protein